MPLILTTPHNEDQGLPDKLTSLVVNHLWRPYVAHALTAFFEREIGTDTTIPGVTETLNNFHALLLDLYDIEYGELSMRLCTIHLDTTIVYTGGEVNRAIFDDSLGPYFYDPDGLFIPSTNTFRAIEAGIYCLFVTIDVIEDARPYNAYIRRVGETDHYAAQQMTPDSSLLQQGSLSALFRLDVNDEIEVLIGAAALSVSPSYGYAAFARLALLA